MDGSNNMTAQELKEARQKIGLSLKDAARIFETPERTWRAWETETGQNARRVPGLLVAALSFYEALPTQTLWVVANEKDARKLSERIAPAKP